MFTIQYEAVNGEHKMQSFDSGSRYKLIQHLARFRRPIVAVYERTTPITKAVRTELAQRPRHTMTADARDFLNSRP